MIAADLILAELSANSKKQAFRAIAEEAAALFGGDAEMLFNALMDRERIGCTGIGGGAAIPHVKVAGVDKTYSVLARLRSPVDFEAVDGAPVDIIFLLLAPAESKTTQHLKLLAQISRFLKTPETCAAIRAARELSALGALLEEWSGIQAA